MKDFTQKVDKSMTFPLSIKTIDDAGKFEGYASTFGNQDSQGDVVVKGAFKKTIGIRKGKWPILWQHSSAQPVGVNIAAEEDDKGLKVSGEINTESSDGKKAYDWMKFSMDRDLPVGLSIGFRIRDKETNNGIRYLKEIQLVEYSIVTFPANEEAAVTGVKSVTDEDVMKAMDFNEALQQEMTERELCDLRWTIEGARSDAMYSVQEDDTLGKDKKLTLIGTIYDQYKTAMMSWWSKWLDFTSEDETDDAEAAADSEVIDVKGNKTKKVDGVNLPSSSFAYVGDSSKLSTWKLPINFPGDQEKTQNHIRLALAMFSRTEGIPAAEHAAVLAKIHDAAKEHGIDSSKTYEVNEIKVGTSISANTKKTLVGAMDCYSQAMEMHKSANKLHAKGSSIISGLIGQAAQKDAGERRILPTPVIVPPIDPNPAPASSDQEKKEAEAKEFANALRDLRNKVVAN